MLQSFRAIPFILIAQYLSRKSCPIENSSWSSRPILRNYYNDGMHFEEWNLLEEEERGEIEDERSDQWMIKREGMIDWNEWSMSELNE